MNYTTLGKSELEVSSICLGSMTWGTQNDRSTFCRNLWCYRNHYR